jgi:hypothetical protein
MACPYFRPQERLADEGKRPRLPLGDPYAGVCRADPGREWRPDENTLRVSCNVGYAASCRRFPRGEGPDAIRFSVIGDEAGALRIFYVAERGHTALEHGALEYSSNQGKFLSEHPNQLLNEQAQAYAESYLRRKRDPEDLARNPHRR